MQTANMPVGTNVG